MLRRGLKLTSLRCDILAAISAEHGESPDELRRKVAIRRGLEPSSPGWPSFSVSFARALRILEEKGAVEVARETILFQKPCMSWVRLTAAGTRERSRAVSRSDETLGRLEPEEPIAQRLRPLIEQASREDLDTLLALVSAERDRRADIA
jgi:hypothetical protein